MASAAAIELLHFKFSPYNEKVRWALDLKRVPHRRRSLLPGPHVPKVRSLTGQTATPALKLDGKWIVGSANILDMLDTRFPTPPLLPDGVDVLAARDIESRFDSDWGPRIRRAVLAALMTDFGYLSACFASGKPAPVRLAYALAAPLAKGMIRRGNGIVGPASVRDGMVAAQEALEHVARLRGDKAYLLGDAFSRADLAAASHLAALCDPPNTPMQRPVSRPAALAELVTTFHNHPSIAWMLAVYERHRMTVEDFDGLH